MAWAFLVSLLSLVIFVVMLRRVIRVARMLRDPEQLRGLFSDEVRAALVEAGLDPDTVRLQEIQESPELARLVGDDLKRVLREAVLGIGSGSSASQRARSLFRSGASAERASGLNGSSERMGQPFLPPPIDQASRGGFRAVALLVIAALVGVAVFLTYSGC
ncbi:MAG: hypothetical protein ABFS46_08865 [Myxococcota bacterium]